VVPATNATTMSFPLSSPLSFSLLLATSSDSQRGKESRKPAKKLFRKNFVEGCFGMYHL
jgi:hypothetical protein